MPLSSADVIQAKTGPLPPSSGATSVEVSLDNPTQEGSTVIVEMVGPAVWPGMPDGWEFDVNTPAAGPFLWVFHRAGIPAGEGVAGSTGWTWGYIAPTNWIWRATEWGPNLEATSPLEEVAAPAGTAASGSGVSSVSTTTTPTTNRAEVVALATHLWVYAANADPSRTFGFGPYTNGFTERDEVRFNAATGEYAVAWSWAFAQATGTFETSATVTTSAPNANDAYYSLLAVYAAAAPEIVPASTVISPVGGSDQS